MIGYGIVQMGGSSVVTEIECQANRREIKLNVFVLLYRW